MSRRPGRLLWVACLTLTLAGVAEAGRTDSLGDPLPDGAVARLGTARLIYPDVLFLAFAPDGKTLALLDLRGKVHLVEVRTGKELRRFSSAPFKIISAGKPTVSLNDGSTQVDPGSGRAWKDNLGAIALSHLYSPEWSPLAISRNGKLLAVAGTDKILRVYDVAAGKELHRLKADDGLFVNVAFAPDGRSLLAGGYGTKVCLWDPVRGKLVKAWHYSQYISHLAFSADGKTVVAADSDGGWPPNLYFHAWDLATGKERSLYQTKGSDGGHPCVLSPDGKLLARPHLAGFTIDLWSPLTGKDVTFTRGHGEGAFYPAFSADGKRLAAPASDGILRVWDTARGRTLFKFKAHPAAVERVALSPDGKILAATTVADQAVHLWDLEKGCELLPLPGHRHGPLSVAFAADGKTVLTASRAWDQTPKRKGEAPGSVIRWDVATGKPGRVLRSPPGEEVWMTFFAADGGRVACVNHDGTIRVWDTARGKELGRLRGPTRDAIVSIRGNVTNVRAPNLHAFRFLPDGKHAVTVEWSLRTWEVPPGRELPGEVGLGNFLLCRLSPEGTTAATAQVDFNNTPQVWLREAASGKELRPCAGVRDFHRCLRFTRDEWTLAGAEGAQVRLWEVASGGERVTALESSAPVYALAFSPDGRVLASGDANGSVCLWEVATGKQLARFTGDGSWVGSLAFSPDGRRLASAGGENFALVWDVARYTKEVQPPVVRVSRRDLERLAEDLAGSDARAAFRALNVLARGGDRAVPLVAGHLGLNLTLDPRRLERLVAELDSNRFAVRQKAQRELERLGKTAESALRAALEGKPSAEVRRRVGRLLERLQKLPPPDPVAALRAVEALEHVGTPKAREVLTTVARRNTDVDLTRAAKAALRRLGSRTAEKR